MKKRFSTILIIIIALMMALPAAAYATTPPPAGAAGGTLSIEYRYMQGETPNIPSEITRFGYRYYLVSQSAPVSLGELPMERSYSYRIEGALSPDQIADVEGLGIVTFTPVHVIFEREVNKWLDVPGLPTNDVEDIVTAYGDHPFTVTQGMDDGKDIEVESTLELTGITFEEVDWEEPAVEGRPGLPGDYTATLAYRGVESYSLLGYYLVDLFIEVTEEDLINTYVIVAEYATDEMPLPLTIDDDMTPLAAGGLTPEEAAAIALQTQNIFTDIGNGNVPLGNFGITGTWSLLSMIMAIVGLTLAVIRAFGLLAWYRRTHPLDDSGTDEDGRAQLLTKRVSILQVLTVIVGAMATVMWMYLDDLSLGVTWINAFTPIVGALCGIAVALFVITGRQRNKALKAADEADSLPDDEAIVA